MAATKTKNSRILDMTNGNSIRLVLKFSIPLLIGYIFQQIYSLVDTMVAGYCLGDSAIAAIGATSSLYALILTTAIGLNAGFSIVITLAFGAKNTSRLKKVIGGTFFLDIIIGVILTSLSLIFINPLMQLMNTPDNILADATAYMSVICGGMLASIVYNMFACILQSFGNSRTSLFFLILSSLLNIVLDLVFVAVLNMGVAGAAIATVLAQGTSGILTGIYVFINYKEFLPSRSELIPHSLIIRDLLASGGAMAFMYCVVDLGSIFYQSATNALGDMYITAFTSSRRVIGLMTQPLLAMMNGFSTFTAQNWGAGKPGRILSTLKKVCGIQIIWGVLSCLIMYIAGDLIICLITGTNDKEIIDNAVMNLKITFPFFPVLGVLLVLRTSMQSIGQKITPVLSSWIELLMKLFSSLFIIPVYGFIGSCLTEPVTWCIMTIFLVIVYLTLTRKKLMSFLRSTESFF